MDDPHPNYDLRSLKAPRAAGKLLRAFVALVENPATGGLLADKLLTDAGVTAFRSLPVAGPPDPVPPAFDQASPPASAEAYAEPDLEALAEDLPELPAGGFRPETAVDIARAYREGKTDPVKVAERCLDIVRQSEQREPAMRLLIAQRQDDLMQQAEASAERFRRGEPRGPLDGVPVAVKDELDQVPYPTTVGTRFLGTEPASADAEAVARLRATGALLLGKANMHEIGLGVTGLNPHHGSARNPYDPARATGGSSSGSAAAVAAGLCPIAVGADGGGSVRIPAALCGVVGLKATFGRVSEHGAAELCWSVAHVGPIGATVADVALGYAVMAGPDPKDPNTLRQPEPDFDEVAQQDLSGLRLGYYRPWFEHAEPTVVSACEKLVGKLTEAGAELRDIAIPELGVLRTAHLITIISEMATAHLQHHARHRQAYALDTRLNLALARKLQAYDYVHAQRHRARLCRHFARAFAEVDAIVTPATGRTAPPLPLDALQSGESNLAVTDAIMRFSPAANLVGFPAIAVPAGYDELGLPVGLQIMGRPWQERVLLRIAAVAEQQVTRRPPKAHYRYLERTG